VAFHCSVSHWRPYWEVSCSEEVFCRPSTAPVVSTRLHITITNNQTELPVLRRQVKAKYICHLFQLHSHAYYAPSSSKVYLLKQVLWYMQMLFTVSHIEPPPSYYCIIMCYLSTGSQPRCGLLTSWHTELMVTSYHMKIII